MPIEDDDNIEEAALVDWYLNELETAILIADDAGDERTLTELEDQVRRLEDELWDAARRMAEAALFTEQKIAEAMESVAAARRSR